MTRSKSSSTADGNLAIQHVAVDQCRGCRSIYLWNFNSTRTAIRARDAAAGFTRRFRSRLGGQHGKTWTPT